MVGEDKTSGEDETEDADDEVEGLENEPGSGVPLFSGENGDSGKR